MNDDLIRREDAIDAHCELCGDRERCNCDICPDVEVFRLLPSAGRMKGKWHQKFYQKVEIMVCSECGNVFSYDAETGVRDYNFCPNCGSDMRG